MAKPIKETPILRGRDAERFNEIIKNNENRKVSASDYERAAQTYKSIKLRGGIN